MNTPTDFVNVVKSLYNKNQPWLRVPVAELRPDNPNGFAWGSSVLRRGKGQQGGQYLRVPGIESIAVECQRKKVFSLYGVVGYKMPKGTSIPQTFTGNIFNEEIDAIMEERNPFGNFVPGSRKISYTDKGGRTKTGRAGTVFLHVPKFSMADGKTKSFLTGSWDFMNTDNNEMVELKSLPEGRDVPTEPGEKAYRQVCAYLHAYKKATGCWIIYLPMDLDKLDPRDSSTFAAFWISRSAAEDEYSTSIEPLMEDVIDKLKWVNGDVSTFYRLINHYEPCDSWDCCGHASEFLTQVDILPDWTIQEKVSVTE
jgi:hypothetical protein